LRPLIKEEDMTKEEENNIEWWINEAVLELESTDDGVTDHAENAIMLLKNALSINKTLETT
jgi:hypothetical protein